MSSGRRASGVFAASAKVRSQVLFDSDRGPMATVLELYVSDYDSCNHLSSHYDAATQRVTRQAGSAALGRIEPARLTAGVITHTSAICAPATDRRLVFGNHGDDG